MSRLSIFVIMLGAMLLVSALPYEHDRYVLVWSEDFNKPELDSSIWEKIRRGNGRWDRYMSNEDRLYEIKKGKLILWGIVNNIVPSDTAQYLTAGVWTRYKKGFKNGRISIRARVPRAQGAWPAIWLMPNDSSYNWPYKGEIDVIEHLNKDNIVYQTLHSGYIDRENGKNTPPSQVQAKINSKKWNVYTVDFDDEFIRMYVNGKKTFEYPNLTDKYGNSQFPFYRELHLIISMQMSGPWAGAVDPRDFPAKLEIDWIKYYEKK